MNVEEKIQIVVDLLSEAFEDKERGAKILDVLSNNMENFATAPGSINSDFHHCYAGGLLDYVLEVHEVLEALYKLFPTPDFSHDELITVSLLHAFGRAGNLKQPYYIPETDRWRVGKGYKFRIAEALGSMDIEDYTIFRLQELGVDLTENEYLAIRLHRNFGSADVARYTFNKRVSNLPMLLHFATMIASKRSTGTGVSLAPKPAVKKTASNNKLKQLADVATDQTKLKDPEKVDEVAADEAKKLFDELFKKP